MSEDRIKEAFVKYMTAEMSLIGPDVMNYEHQPYSRSFKKRFRALVRSEKYFGGSIRMYRYVRRVAVFVAVVVGLLGINEVSARTIGFNVWDVFSSYDAESETIDYSYKDRIHDAPTAVRDIPNYVPEGMKKLPDVTNEDAILSEWRSQKTGDKCCIQYARDRITETGILFVDGDYVKKENVDISGIRAKICYKDSDMKHAWIDWADSDYGYHIEVYNMDGARETLISMAESIYR